MRKILDSNYLQSPMLEEYLGSSVENLVVVADYLSMEAYKGDTLKSIFPSMDILSRYPHQVLILKGTREIGAMIDEVTDPAARLVDAEATEEFVRYCELLPIARSGDPNLRRQLVELGRTASHQFSRLDSDLENFGSVLRELEAIFADVDIHALRTGGDLSEDFFSDLTKNAMLMSRFLFKSHPDVDELPTSTALPDTFLFRMAVSATFLAASWISVGGADSVKTERLRNDFVDANLATYATYFDGFLTNDRRASEIYERTAALSAAFRTTMRVA